MYHLKRTHSGNPDFKALVKELDHDLAIRDGADHVFFAPFNKIDNIRHVVLAYEGATAVGCGALKEYQPGTMELKRMFVHAGKRGKGIATLMIRELEKWAGELNYARCILETGEQQPEAIGLYKKNNYRVIENYGQYADVSGSVCFEKHLPPEH